MNASYRREAPPLEFLCVPRSIDRTIRGFCEEFCTGMKPLYVPVRVEPDAHLLECYDNVHSVIRRAGGEIVYGWVIWTIPQLLIEAEHHGFWRSPGGNLIDPTPHDPETDRILFLPDTSTPFTGQAIGRRRKALCFHPLVEKYIVYGEERERIQTSVLPGEEFSIDQQVYERLWVGEPEFGRAFAKLVLSLRGYSDPCLCGSKRKYGQCCKGQIGIR